MEGPYVNYITLFRGKGGRLRLRCAIVRYGKSDSEEGRGIKKWPN